MGSFLDCDLGKSVDDALALVLLHGFASQKEPEARLASVSLTKSNLPPRSASL